MHGKDWGIILCRWGERHRAAMGVHVRSENGHETKDDGSLVFQKP